jgi:hypothetical protein
MRKVVLMVLLFLCQPATAQNSFINGLTHGNESITCDLPGSQHIKNIGSKIDGSGMCVFTSVEMAALHAGLEQMRGFRNWVADKYAGGGWPDKVDKCLTAYFKEKNLPPIPYIQYEGKNPEQILDLCEKTGRMAGITYGYSPRYGQAIQHMTNAVMFKNDYGVVLDNNFPGEDRYEWVTRAELIRRTIYPNRSAWVFVWLHQGPPPSPRNKKEVDQ